MFRVPRRWIAAIARLSLAITLAGCERDPAPAPIAHGRVVPMHFPAPTLGLAVRDAIVYLPPSYDTPAAHARRYPVVYLLHGGPGWPGDWFQHGDAQRTFDQLIATRRIPELIAVAPDGRGAGRKGMSLWLDNWNGTSRIETYFTHDVIAAVDSALRTLPDARHRAIAGISDGGDAALRLLFEHPDLFAAGAGLSGRYHPHAIQGLEAVVGPEPWRSRMLQHEAALRVASEAALKLAGKSIYYDSGVFDPTAWDVVAMDVRLESLGVAHVSHLYAGYHDWPFWSRRLAVALPVITSGFAAVPRPVPAAVSGGSAPAQKP